MKCIKINFTCFYLFKVGARKFQVAHGADILFPLDTATLEQSSRGARQWQEPPGVKGGQPLLKDPSLNLDAAHTISRG